MARHALVMLMLLFTGAPWAYAESTLLSMRSEPGDYIGAGQDHLYLQSDGTFTASRNFDNGVSIFFRTAGFEHFWHADFAAPHGQLLTPGTYSGAVRFPFQPEDLPGLDVSGDGRGCNTLTGSFEVLQITYGADDSIEAFRATFEQHCEGAGPALRGEVRFNATVPVELAVPTQVSVFEGSTLSFILTAAAIGGGPLTLSAIGVPAGASLVDNSNNTATFTWTPAPGQAGTYSIEFRATNENGVSETVLTRLTVLAPPPPNDELEGAVAVPFVPFTYMQSTAGATTAIDDPFCNGNGASVWFTVTAQEAMRIEADTFGSGYDTTLSVYTGSRGALVQLACNDNADGTQQSRTMFDASPGVTYFFLVSAFNAGIGGPLTFNVRQGPPPLSVEGNVFRFGSVSPTTGASALSGSVSCSQPGFVTVFGQLRQTRGGTTLTGFFSTFVPCSGTGTESWSADVFVQPALFRGRAVALLVAGPATVSASVFAFDPETGEFVQRDFVAHVILKGGQ